MAVSPIDSRYKTEMNSLFDEKKKLELWMEVEAALARAHEKLGHIPQGSADEIAAGAKKVELARAKEIEDEIHHDLMAMVRALSEKCGKSSAYVHLGATSYDIEDTALAMQMRDAGGLLRSRLEQALDVLQNLAKEKKNLVCVGRTHGQHAVPTTYGMKFALYYDALKRNLMRLDNAISQISYGKMSGAVGTMATFGEDAIKLQELAMADLGLKPAPITCQVIGRDRHAYMIFCIALIASSIEQIAKEIRNLSRNEILEVAEGFSKKQVGSSTMPQKRNPHKSERLCSLARLVRSNASVALENIPLEHERDLTNSANERFIIPESFILCDYMLLQAHKVLSELEFFEENIEQNLQLSQGAIMAERVMIKLAEKGMGRQEAHELMREAAKEAFSQKKHLKEILSHHEEASKYLSEAELESLFEPKTYIGKAGEIVKKVIGDD
ncbi:MAG: adenylosuccinate lyase [Candidatus Micrarchaeota archaeon]